jgi:hypothetical protein
MKMDFLQVIEQLPKDALFDLMEELFYVDSTKEKMHTMRIINNG